MTETRKLAAILAADVKANAVSGRSNDPHFIECLRRAGMPEA